MTGGPDEESERFRNALELDPPFSYHSPNPRNKEVLEGAQADELERAMRVVYKLSLVNPVMTAIVGQPGAGKTHFLHHTEFQVNSGNRPGLAVIYDLKDSTPDPSDLLEFILRAPQAEAYLGAVDHARPREERLQALLEAGRNKHGDEFGIILGVDAVDEHIRQLLTDDDPGGERAIVGLLGSFRLLMDAVPRLCITFALTNDVYIPLSTVARRDPTLRRRFVVPNGANGEPIRFDIFELKEVRRMVGKFMRRWAERNAISTTFWDDNSTWPFTPQALELVWKVTASPGGISLLCQDALMEKFVTGEERLPVTAEEQISRRDMAHVIDRNKTFAYFVIEEDVLDQVDYLIRQEEFRELRDALDRIDPTPEIDLLREGLAEHLRHLRFDVTERSANELSVTRATVRDTPNVLIHIAENGTVDFERMRAIGDALEAGQVAAAWITGPSTNGTIEVATEQQGRHALLRGDADYAPMVYVSPFPHKFAPALSHASGIQNPTDKRRWLRHLEEECRFTHVIERLLTAEPARRRG